MTDEGPEVQASEDRKKGFYICPIGGPGSDARKRGNQVYKHVVCAALEPLGFEMARADTLEQSGLITSQIINNLLSVELVIADLTDQNPNVFYELAVRHAIRKPFIQLMAEGQKLPFDIQGLRTVYLDYKDLDSTYEARRTIAGMVSSIEQGDAIETPMTYTLDLQSLRQSEDSEARGIAEIIDEIGSLKRLVSRTSTLSPRVSNTNLSALQAFMLDLAKAGRVREDEVMELIQETTSARFDKWVTETLAPLARQREYGDEPPF